MKLIAICKLGYSEYYYITPGIDTFHISFNRYDAKIFNKIEADSLLQLAARRFKNWEITFEKVHTAIC